MLNSGVFTMDNPNTEKLGDLLSQLGSLVGVGKREDGRFYLADMSASAAKINIWAAYKPIRSSKKVNITEDDRLSANCGLTWQTAASPKDCMTIYNQGNELNGWEYLRPRGAAYNEPFRIRDWNGYRKDATSPFSALAYPNSGINKQGAEFKAQAMMPSGDVDFVNITKLANIKDRYFGVQIRQGNSIRTKTASSTIGAGGSDIVISTFQIPTGEYDVIPFIAPKALDATTEVLNVECIPIPYNSVGKLTIYDSYYVIILEGRTTGTSTIEYRFTIKNASGANKTFTTNRIYFRLGDKAFSDPMTTAERTGIVANITVAAGETYDSGWLSQTVSASVFANPKLWLSLGSGEEIRSVIPMAQSDKS